MLSKSIRIPLFGHLILLVLFIKPGLMMAQQPFCDVATDAEFHLEFDRLIQRTSPSHRRSASETIQVPLVFHIETNNGNPVYNVNTLLNKLALVNTYFLAANVQFVNCAPIVFYPEGNSERISNILNVYLNDGPTGCGSYIGSTIYINVNCNRTFEHILAHELGHALGLPHTHGYTNNGTTTELVDGSNCTTDGDRFCDTPADPNLLGKVDGQCNYTGNAVDANGQQYQPDTTNIMSYTRSTCADKFSPEQLNKMYMVAQALNYECCRIDPPLLTDTTICAGEPVTLTASTNLPQGEVRWYDVAQGGQPIATGLQYTTQILHASKALYAEVVDSCISDRVSVLITVSPEGGLTTSSAKIFADLDTSAQGSNPYFFTEFNDSVHIFNALNLSLYYTTATSDTAHLLTDAFQSMNGGNISGLAVLGSDIIVATNSFDTGPSLWRVTYPNGDRTLLKSFGTDYGYSNFWLTTHGQHVFGQLNNTVSHPGNEIAEIWKTNGTSVGTVLVKNLAPTPAFANFEFTSFNSKLFFVGGSDAHGDELWATDGSAAGTVMIKDIFPGPTGSQISEFTIKDAQLFFTANDSLHGTELWMTDGTTAGTQLAVDINSGINGSYVYGITNIGGMLYFSADNGVDGQEPYQSDGTSAGTTQLANLRPDGSSTPHGFTQFGEIIYFRANRSVFDYELFGYSINLDETHLIKDINPTGSSTPDNLFVHDNQLFFTAFSPGVGTEIWTSDGSLNGTQMVTDIWPGAPSSNPQQFFTSGGRLLFVANDGSGAEIWQLTVPLYAACWGDSVVIEVTNSNPVKWYADSLGQVFLEEGTSFTVYDVTQTTTIYGEIIEQDCTSPLYPITIFMKDDCPCVGPALLTLNEIFSQADQFTIHAQDQLHSMSHFESGSDMKFKAAGEIQFQPGFQVNLGAIFRANIEPCQE